MTRAASLCTTVRRGGKRAAVCTPVQLASPPAVHEARAVKYRADAERQLDLAHAAKTCTTRTHHAINAIQSAAWYNAEMDGVEHERGASGRQWSTLDLGRQARDIVDICVRRIPRGARKRR